MSEPIHRIRLRTPWNGYVQDPQSQAWQPMDGRVALPFRWEQGSGAPRLERRWNLPTGLSPQQRLIIEIQANPCPESVDCNGTELLPLESAPGLYCYSLPSAAFRPFNQLSIRWSQPEGQLHQVALLIVGT